MPSRYEEMTVHPAAPADAPPRTRSGWRLFWRALIALAMVAVVLATAGLIWGARHYQALIGLGKDAQAQYTATNHTFTFTPPAPSHLPTAERWQAMLRVRQSADTGLTPGLERALGKALDAPKLQRVDLVLSLLASTPALRGLMNDHLAALRREHMSVAEYQWLLGLAMNQAIADPARHPAGRAYIDQAKDFERLSLADRDPDNDVNAELILHGLAMAYKKYSMDQPAVLDALDHSNRAAYLLDWLALGAQALVPNDDDEPGA